MTLDPVAVALKFGFIAVLYLFLLWMARSALKDLRRTTGDGGANGRGGGAPAYEDATGMHVASSGFAGDGDGVEGHDLSSWKTISEVPRVMVSPSLSDCAP